MPQQRFIPKRRERPEDIQRSLAASETLQRNKEEILLEWERIVCTRIPAADKEERAVLRDHLPEFIDELVRALNPGFEKTIACTDSDVCERHGVQRADQTKFEIHHILSEYCILQSVIFEALRREVELSDHEVDVVVQSVNQAMREAVQAYAEQTGIVQETLNSELRRSNAELSRFAGIAAHDLKAPINTISQFLELIKDDLKDRRYLDIDEYVGFVSTASSRIRTLIDNLLIYARVGGTQESNFEIVDLNEIAENVKTTLKATIDSTEAEFSWKSLPTVTGVRFELEQLVQNLVSNSLKFRKADERTFVRITCEQDESAYQLKVTDNGIGIDRKDAEQIFKPFQRTEASTQFEGTGLGLAIVQRVVDHHGGKIWLESEIGKGCVFHISIPKT
ncbi:MAG: ATP-binding protein [Bdellovibrionota bacterium]